MTTQRRYREIEDYLRGEGFRRRKRVWNRSSGPYVDVITLQTSKSRDAITLNLGVADPRIYEQVWAAPLPAFADEAMCIVRTRLAALVDGRDRWWSLSSPDFAVDVISMIRLYGMPFFERLHSDGALIDFLDQSAQAKYPPEILYHALLLHREGRRDAACVVLKAFASRSGAWSGRAKPIMAALNCSE